MPRRCLLHCSRRRPDEQLDTEAATQTEAEGPPESGTGLSPALGRWIRLIHSFRKIRKLQLLFHNTGERLKDFPKSLRDGLSKENPKI